jgi:DNA-binding CsgD family transcriptional regulator
LNVDDLARVPHERERDFARLGVLLFATVAVLVALDVGSDAGHGASMGHLAVEGAAAVLALAGALLFASRLLALARARRQERDALRREVGELEHDLAAVREQAERWRSESKHLIDGLGAAIEAQLQRWRLTTAEAEVAWLLLKGLSHGEIAGVRGVSERTVRQQAQAVYRKAGLAGRAELSAFFLEDLLQPRRAGERPAGDDVSP